MKKLLLLLPFLGIALLPSLANATQVGDLPRGTHLKVDICHNVSHNPHIVPVSINAVFNVNQNTQHGDLKINAQLKLVSFVPHNSGGHDKDFIVRIYLKHGNTEVNTYVSEKKCELPPTTTTTVPPTTTTTAPPTTTTTAPPVTTTTVPAVTTTTEAPRATTTTAPATVTTAAPSKPATPAQPTPVAQPASPPAEQLPHTGAGSTMALVAIGAALVALGRSLRLLERDKHGKFAFPKRAQ